MYNLYDFDNARVDWANNNKGLIKNLGVLKQFGEGHSAREICGVVEFISTFRLNTYNDSARGDVVQFIDVYVDCSKNGEEIGKRFNDLREKRDALRVQDSNNNSVTYLNDNVTLDLFNKIERIINMINKASITTKTVNNDSYTSKFVVFEGYEDCLNDMRRRAADYIGKLVDRKEADKKKRVSNKKQASPE